MGNKENVIELNGKRYDAKTGRQIETNTSQNHIAVPRHIDDVVNRVAKAAKPHPKIPAGRIHHRSSKSSTLTRKAVKKPAPSRKVISMQSSRVSDISRAKRANTVNQSKLIKHFNMGSISGTIKRAASLPVKTAPSLQAPISMPTKWPLAAKQGRRLQNPLDASTAHEQSKIKKTKIHHRAAKKLHVKNRTLNVIVGLIVFLGVGGFLAYQNMPELALKLAAARAGIHASLPSYQPAGFSLSGPVGYNTGQVKISYKSNTDNRSYSITETATPWDSTTLLQNFIISNSYKYQTFQDNGKTIYIYNGNATWIDGGVWYQVLGNSVLSSDQLIGVAASI